MSERMQAAKAVRVQSSAVVLAAVITSAGALVSTLIQMNLKPPSSSGKPGTEEPFSDLDPPVVDWLPRTKQEVAEFNPLKQVAAAKVKQVALNEPARLSESTESFSRGVTLPEQPASQRLNWNVAKPAIAASASPVVSVPAPISVSAPFVSPWYYLQQSQPASAARASKKFEWNSLSKMFRWPS